MRSKQMSGKIGVVAWSWEEGDPVFLMGGFVSVAVFVRSERALIAG